MIIGEEVLNYKIIRQPYRITMAKWDFTVTQKRILTKIISLLQKEISLVAKGMPIGQLEIFSNVDDSIKPEVETILTGLIERAVLTKHSRNVTVIIHKATAQELVKATNGLTQFAEEVMYRTDNSYTQKLYELISHWKDKEVFSISPDDFREKLSLTDKYPLIKDLIRRIIKPAEVELKEIADVFFIFNTSATGRKITKFNFVIKHKKTLHQDELNQIRLRDDNIHLLKAHLGFRSDHIDSIADILYSNDLIGELRNKIIELYAYVQEAARTPQTAIKKVPEYIIRSLKNEFDSRIK